MRFLSGPETNFLKLLPSNIWLEVWSSVAILKGRKNMRSLWSRRLLKMATPSLWHRWGCCLLMVLIWVSIVPGLLNILVRRDWAIAYSNRGYSWRKWQSNTTTWHFPLSSILSWWWWGIKTLSLIACIFTRFMAKMCFNLTAFHGQLVKPA